ncbi:MAG TPA: hemerythrin family protein [Anaeromyxobacter sp.]
MPRLDAATLPDLPLEFMNADHAREVALVNELEDALAAYARGDGPVASILVRLSLLAVHTREHFLREESTMREARFPAYPVHKAEHDRVLAGMDAEARAFRAGGDPERLARYLRETLPEWFEGHVRTMDVVTARFVAANADATGAL